MTYLLDTNIFIIMLEKSYHRLSTKQREILSEPTNLFYLSEASLYEIGIKSRLQREDFAHINLTTIEQERRRLKIKLLNSKQVFYTNIPNVPQVLKRNGDKHGDPFDLLIISQALVENLLVISTDEYFPSYTGLTIIA